MVTVITFGGWALFAASIVMWGACMFVAGVPGKPAWLAAAGLVGAACFVVGVLANMGFSLLLEGKYLGTKEVPA